MIETKKERILSIVRDLGDYGATVDEVEILTGIPHQTASSAVHYAARDGLLRDTGKQRPTRYGGFGVVWEYAA